MLSEPNDKASDVVMFINSIMLIYSVILTCIPEDLKRVLELTQGVFMRLLYRRETL